MTRLPSVLAVAMQLLVLTYMAGEREWVVQTGQTVYLRTAPIDPRDVMRGDYVRLDYEVSHVPQDKLRGGLAQLAPDPQAVQRDQRVYAVLRENEEGLAELETLSDQRPTAGLFLRGRLGRPWWHGEIQVRYGLEAYFMQQGQALALEQLRNRGDIQVPLEMAVAVRRDGLAVIKSHRWSALGIGLELQTVPPPENAPTWQPRPVLSATVRLFNASSNALAIVDLPNAQSLALVPDLRRGANPWRWVGADQRPPDAQRDQVIVLQPGQIHAIHVAFTDSMWYVVNTSKTGSDAAPRSLSDVSLDWSARFRFVYCPPNGAACQNLPHTNLIWHGQLPSRAFAGGRPD